MMKKMMSIMLLSLSLMSMGSYANMAVSTSIINTVAASSVIDDPEPEMVKNSAKEKSYTVEPAGSYMFTICSNEQVQTALAWQTVCVADKRKGFNNSMCPVLSYMRFCQPAISKEVMGLKPVKAHYKNIFYKE